LVSFDEMWTVECLFIDVGWWRKGKIDVWYRYGVLFSLINSIDISKQSLYVSIFHDLSCMHMPGY
jgi:hypothetical protein